MRPHRQRHFGVNRHIQQNHYDGHRHHTTQDYGYHYNTTHPYDYNDYANAGNTHYTGSEYGYFGHVYRGYDGYGETNHAYAGWDQPSYDHNPNYTYYYDQSGGQRNYSYSGYRSNHGTPSYNYYDNREGNSRDRYRDQRRSYHSSSHRRRVNMDNQDAGGGSMGQSLAGRLAEHQDRVFSSPTSSVYRGRTYDHPISSMRNYDDRTTTRRSPRLFLPRREQPMEGEEQEQTQQLGPDEAYLSTSLEESRTTSLEGLVRKLLVLDLNGTLVYRTPHRWNRERKIGEDVYAQFDPTQPRPLRTTHPRPYLAAFCDFLLHPETKKWLDTMVWSSAQPHSVNDMVGKCFGGRKEELVAIWARDRLGLNRNDYGRKVQTTKDLNKPWEELGGASQRHSARTTLLLDDSPLKAHLQPYNHLCIKEYDGEMRRRDVGIRELEVARKNLADVWEGKKGIEDVLKEKEEAGLEEVEVVGDRKRKRQEKKENKRKEKIEQQFKKLATGDESPDGVYDETLLAIVGILDAAKKESNIAAWVRAGGLINSFPTGDEEEEKKPPLSEGGSPSLSNPGSPKTKKAKLTEGSAARSASVAPSNSPIDHLQQSLPSTPSFSLPLPCEASADVPSGETESETEKTGVPLGDSAKDVEAQLWFHHPGTLTFWAMKGRKVLEEMGIDVMPGVVGSTG